MKHPKRPPITLQDFFENEVRPALAAGLASAFPEFGFRRGRGEWWTATAAPSGFEDYGVRERKLTANAWGLRSFKSSAVAVPWTAYILGRTEAPRGADFVEAVKKLAERLGLDASVLDRERTPEQVEEDHKRVRRGDLLEDFVAEAHAVLVDPTAGKNARDYLTRRGFKAEDFDINNGYDCIRASISDVGTNAQYGCVLYIPYDPVVQTAPESMLGVIAD